MDNTIKPLSRLLLLIILMNGSCLLVLANCSVVKGGYKASAPEFIVEFVDSSYDVPPTFKINQYTGETVIDKRGYYVENKSLVITIKNQAFPTYFNGKRCHIAYNIAVKGHFGEAWTGLDFDSQYTMKKYLSEGFPRGSRYGYTVVSVSANNYPVGTQLDIKVQAYVGYESVIEVTDYYGGGAWWFPAGSHDEDGIIFDTEGDWSDIQTFTINSNNVMVVDEPEATDDTETPTISDGTTTSNEQGTLDLTWVAKDDSSQIEEFVAIFGVAAIVAALVVGLFVYFRIRKR